MAVSVAFEGPEGVGKTTQARLLGTLLERGYGVPVLQLREPGGTPAGEAIREILLGGDYTEIDPATHMLLFSAARNEMVSKKLVPWMQRNPRGIAITDRCWWSTKVIQEIDGADSEYINDVQHPFVKIWPDVVVYIDLPAEESMVRVEVAKRFGLKTDWRDEQSLETFQKIREGYQWLADSPGYISLIRVDGYLEPWDIAFRLVEKIRQTRQVHREENNELRQMLNPENLKISFETLVEMSIKEGRSEHSLQEVVRSIPEIRRELGVNSDELRAKMYEEWPSEIERSRGIRFRLERE